jgi:hypothetical protein
MLEGKLKYLGIYKSLDEAVAVRQAAEAQYFEEFSPRKCRGDEPC